MISFTHATNIAHHYARLLGVDREAGAHPSWSHQHGHHDEATQRRLLVALVDKMRESSYVTTGEQGRLLVEYADATRAELGLPPPGGA